MPLMIVLSDLLMIGDKWFIFVKLDSAGDYVYQEDFITGWLQNEKDWGRPVSPFIMRDGSMLISDDKYDVIYKIQYKG